MDWETFKHYSTLAVYTRFPFHFCRGLPRVRLEKFSAIWKIFLWCGTLVTAVTAIAAIVLVVITSTSHSAPLSNLNLCIPPLHFSFSFFVCFFVLRFEFARLYFQLPVHCRLENIIFFSRVALFCFFLLMWSVTSRIGIHIFTFSSLSFLVFVVVKVPIRFEWFGERNHRKRKTLVPKEKLKSTTNIQNDFCIEPTIELNTGAIQFVYQFLRKSVLKYS